MRRLFLLLALTLAACERPLFPDTYGELIARHTRLPGHIYSITGDTYGPFRLLAIVTGKVGEAGAMEPGDLGVPARILWPATPGYYYQGYKYKNEFDAPLYIIHKIPAHIPPPP